jgi:hypothetical protein
MLTFSSQVLHQAYTQQFRGQNATQFLDYLLETDASVRGGQVIYVKSVSIVQSSGTGKSRMLTEVRFFDFTRLLINLSLDWEADLHPSYMSLRSSRPRLSTNRSCRL